MSTAWPAELAALGPYFAVEHHPADAAARPPWRTLDDLVSDPDLVLERVETVRRGLAAMGGLPGEEIETRVAASVAHLGITARLVSPALAVAVSGGIILDFAGAWWQPVPGGPIPLSLPFAQPENAEPDVAAAFATRILGGPVRALAEAFAHMSVSPRIRWGNVASALHGAATMLGRSRPEWTARTRALTAALREREPLAGTGEVDAAGRFRRHSCCLIYRAAPDRAGPVCGDCVLAKS